jgi:hypothetical protein
MAAATTSKILLRIKKQRNIGRCSICGKKLKKFTRRRTGQNPLSCWQCMILNADSECPCFIMEIKIKTKKEGKKKQNN